MPERNLKKRLIADCCEAAQQFSAIMTRTSDPDWLSLDLTMGQFKAMMTLSVYGSQPVGELGRRLGLSEPASSLLADKLEERGLAGRKRDPEDGRRTLVTLTSHGAELAATLRQGRWEQLELWLDGLGTHELEGLAQGLRGLLRAAEDGMSTSTSGGTSSARPDGQAGRG
jgi:DNA-binding MarR family transcriptional regulator